MKKLLLFLTAFTIVKANAQISSMGFAGMQVPQYMGSSQGGGNRLPVVFRARVIGLPPNTAFKYAVQGIVSSDFNSASLFPGAGEPMFLDSGNWKTTTTPDFNNAAGHDTLYTNMMGEHEGWFGFTYNTDSRFKPGNKVYPYLVIVGVTTTDTFRYYLHDSIHVLAFGKGSGADSGTGIWGHSMAKGKSFVALYDNTLGMGRPLATSMVENDGISIGSNAVPFYKNSVEGTNGNWGCILPNSLASGVKRIANLDRYMGMASYANNDDDGVWGPSSKSTVNPSGGLTPIVFDENDAALIAPDIQFWARTSITPENVATKEIYVVRKYSNDQNQSVRLTVVGGTATQGSSDDYDLNVPKTITFTPGGPATDTTKITVYDDAAAEGDETVVIRLDQANNCVIGTEVAHTMTIKDNDISKISMGARYMTAKEDVGFVSIKIKMDKAIGTPLTLRLLVKDQGDSSYIPGELQLGSSGKDSIFSLGKPTGPDSILIRAKIIDDTDKDQHDTFDFVVRRIAGLAELSADTLTTVVIYDNDGPAIISFIDKALVVTEKTTSVNVKVKVSYKTDAGGDFTLRLLTSGSTATQGQDFTFSPSSKIISIDQNTPDTIVVNIPLMDDDNYEVTEKIIFNLGFLSNVVIQKPDSLVISIINDDYAIHPISLIAKQVGSTRTVDSLNVKCRISGVVHGGNLRTTGSQFTLIDKTGGISVVSTSKTFGYTVTEGDTLLIQGIVGQTNGLAVFQSLDTIIRLGGNRTLDATSVVGDIAESNESRMVKFTRVKLVDASKWPSSALGANSTAMVGVAHTNGTVDTLLIDAETNIDGTAAPSGYFNVTGIGGQSDASSPYTVGYYLAPRRLTDFEAASLPMVQFQKTSDTITELADSFRLDFKVAPLDENFTFDVVVKGGTAASPGDYNFANRTISVIKNNSVNSIRANISDELIEDGTRTVIFAVRNPVGPGAIGPDSLLTLVILDNEPSSVKRLAAGSIRMYPNPSEGQIYLSAVSPLRSVQIYAIDGKMVYQSLVTGTEAELNVTGLNPGIYTVKVTTAEGKVYSDLLHMQ